MSGLSASLVLRVHAWWRRLGLQVRLAVLFVEHLDLEVTLQVVEVLFGERFVESARHP